MSCASQQLLQFFMSTEKADDLKTTVTVLVGPRSGQQDNEVGGGKPISLYHEPLLKVPNVSGNGKHAWKGRIEHLPWDSWSIVQRSPMNTSYYTINHAWWSANYKYTYLQMARATKYTAGYWRWAWDTMRLVSFLCPTKTCASNMTSTNQSHLCCTNRKTFLHTDA